MKVYVDHYNVIGDDREVPRSLGDSTNLIDAKLLEDYNWAAGSWTEIPEQADITVEEYQAFRDAVDQINSILKKVYDQLEDDE